jgi:dihydrofolate reductase
MGAAQAKQAYVEEERTHGHEVTHRERREFQPGRELVRGDLGKAVQQLKRESGKGLFVGGVKLPLALAELGLIDEYEFVVQPRIVGHGPTLFAGLSKRAWFRRRLRG